MTLYPFPLMLALFALACMIIMLIVDLINLHSPITSRDDVSDDAHDELDEHDELIAHADVALDALDDRIDPRIVYAHLTNAIASHVYSVSILYDFDDATRDLYENELHELYTRSVYDYDARLTLFRDFARSRVLTRDDVRALALDVYALVDMMRNS